MKAHDLLESKKVALAQIEQECERELDRLAQVLSDKSVDLAARMKMARSAQNALASLEFKRASLADVVESLSAFLLFQ